MTIVAPNANFHTGTDGTVFDVRLENPKFKEYRRRWQEAPTAFEPGKFPIHLDIESTGLCNLRCPFCATTARNWGTNNRGYIEVGMFQRIIDEGRQNGLCSIKFSFRGEPLLHARLPEMVQYAKSNGILDVYFNTNATLLNESLIHALLNADLDRISISMEGTTKDVYEGLRVGARFEQVVGNIRALRRIRDARGVTNPQIRIQTVLSRESMSTFKDYVEFWSPLADEVSYLDMRREGSEDDHRGQVAEWACAMLWQRMTILWDGTLLPCLMHGVADFGLMSLGNVADVSIRKMWTSDRMEHIRLLHKSGRAHELEACDRCSYRAMELEKIGYRKL